MNLQPKYRFHHDILWLLQTVTHQTSTGLNTPPGYITQEKITLSQRSELRIHDTRLCLEQISRCVQLSEKRLNL